MLGICMYSITATAITAKTAYAGGSQPGNCADDDDPGRD